MKFAVVSDVHAERHNDWSTLVFERLAARADLDFVAFLGDICTSPGDSWERWFKPLQDKIKCPIFPCRGNHDPLEKWRNWWKTPDDYVKVFPEMRCLFMDSDAWRHDDGKKDWIKSNIKGGEKYKFLFTHLTPRLGHWNYGLGPNRTKIITDCCKGNTVTACFTGHMHGFDVQHRDGTWFFICGGGGGNRHDNFPVMHRSNFYLLVDAGERFHISLCQQHRDREQVRPWEEWMYETRRPAF